MSQTLKAILYFAIMAAMLLGVGYVQSWSLALVIVNMCLISAVMTLGVNIQWGYAGLFNVGVMGFAALGGVAAMLTSIAPVAGAWRAGGTGVGITFLLLILCIFSVVMLKRVMRPSYLRNTMIAVAVIIGLIAMRVNLLPATEAVEDFEPARTGFLGGLGLPILLSWIIGGFFAAGAAWIIGRISLGLRSDYLAIATLGISEIIIAILKNEDWLTRGVKNVSGLPRPVPYEVDLQSTQWFINLVEKFNAGSLLIGDPVYAAQLKQHVVTASSLFVKSCYTALFLTVLLLVMWLSKRAQSAPWGRMMRAIRDNEVAANAMGKNVTARHLQVFVIGSAVIGVAGAMLTTLDGQFTPGTYNPLRYTFLIWVMVIVGGSGNNLGSVLGAFFVWFFWIEAEPLGQWFIQFATSGLDPGSALRQQLLNNASHMRLVLMGLVLLIVLRFSPKGLLPEQVRR